MKCPKDCGKCCSYIINELKCGKCGAITKFNLTCKHFDSKTKKCGIYYKRPLVCRQYFCEKVKNPAKWKFKKGVWTEVG